MPTNPLQEEASKLLSPLENTRPFLKWCLEGEAGSGKSQTAVLLAIGLHKEIKSKKPIVMVDSERAAKFSIPLFKEAGIEVMVKETRSLADLVAIRNLCSKGYSDIMLTDSVTGIYQDFENAYLRKKNRTTMQIQDYKPVRTDWRNLFVLPMIDAPVHIIDTGRIQDKTENYINDDGDKEFKKIGIVMQGGKNTENEYDVVLLMERKEHRDQKTKKLTVWREALVYKGRGGLQDGQVIKNPTYEDFKGTIQFILANGVPKTIAETDAATLIKTEDDKRDFIQSRDVALEKIEAYLTQVWPGSSKEEKKNKVDAVEFAYGTLSWTEVTKMKPEVLTAGLEKLREFVAKKTEEAAKTE